MFLSPAAVFFGLILRSVMTRRASVPIHHRRRLPFVLVGPAEGQRFKRTANRHRGKAFESLHKNLVLQLGLMRFAGGVSEWIIEKRRPRWVPRFENVQRAPHT